MTESQPYILDAPLPEALDFHALKTNGLTQLKSLAGKVWTNFNDNDPGVTILDQLCYALTELGYCARFPIEDVLTEQNGKIRYEGQFFEPQKVLTCAPVTTDDYRKLVHDRLDEVEAIYITAEPCGSDSTVPTGRYVVYLVPRLGNKHPKRLLRAVHRLLNGHRNLAEVFIEPKVLTSQVIGLTGTVTLSASADAALVNSQIVEVLRSYAVPPAIQSGYQQLRDLGVDADLIFNGPNLHKGWISGANALPGKTNSINLFRLNTLLGAIEGVAQVQMLQLKKLLEVPSTKITILEDEVAVIDGTNLKVVQNGVAAFPIKLTDEELVFLSQMRGRHKAASVSASVDPFPVPVQGRYRRIEDYYSVQNTFPDTYGIGHNSLQSQATSYRVASARQLKGYLMVFDQLLANQFSQLAHIGDLFSFVPQARPSGEMSGGGMAYRSSGPTYFCQALYSVPDVMPMLLGNEAYRYQTDPTQSVGQVDRDAWARYQKSPSNAYMHGLNAILESTAQAEQRRDGMLSHLMARHGDQASLYDNMIKYTQWHGSEAKTRIVVKSRWLQNYRELSYYRSSAFDPWAATPLKMVSNEHHSYHSPRLHDSPHTEVEAKLPSADFVNFSTFELKADILLGIAEHLLAVSGKIAALLEAQSFEDWLKKPLNGRVDYCLLYSDLSVRCVKGQHRVYEGTQQLMYIAATAKGTVDREHYVSHLNQLYWLATQRKGFLLIEHVLLLPESDAGEPDTAQDSKHYFLSASVIFPEYICLHQHGAFEGFVDTLVERHWPAHVGLKQVSMSHVALRALISQFVIWHNTISSDTRRYAGRRNTAAQVMAKLLKLPPVKEVPHASQ